MAEAVFMMDCGDAYRRADNGGYKILEKTAAYTVTTADTGSLITNKGASGAVVFTLPSLAAQSPAKKGLTYYFAKVAAQNMTITAAGGATINNSAANGTYANTTNGDAGAGGVTVYTPDGVNWFVRSTVGTWATT